MCYNTTQVSAVHSSTYFRVGCLLTLWGHINQVSSRDQVINRQRQVTRVLEISVTIKKSRL